MKQPLVAFALLAGLGWNPVCAETIFRCGKAYSTIACPDATAIVIAGTVSAEQRAEARDVVSREKALAAEMARDRRLREAALKPALAGSLSGPPRIATPPPAAATKKPAKKRKRSAAFDEERDFIAAVPKARKTDR